MNGDADDLAGDHWVFSLDPRRERAEYEQYGEAEVSDRMLGLARHFQVPEIDT